MNSDTIGSGKCPSGTLSTMTFAELAATIVERRELSSDEAEALMHLLLDGQATPGQIGGALLALRTKGTTTRELAAFSRAMRARMSDLTHPYEDLVDTCGTGGGSPSFNMSTAAAFIASAAGVRIAKHGNRAVTSKCGMADVLQALGVPLSLESESTLTQLRTHGLVFLFAPNYHPAMQHVGAVRKELGVRTVFNQLGPLATPARATRQLIGVYEYAIMRSMGEALRELGAHRALIVHGRDHLDEISPCTTTDAVRLVDGVVENTTISPFDFGRQPIDPSALLPADDALGNAEILLEAITNADSPRAHAVIPNAAATIWLAELAPDLKVAAQLAEDAIRSGAARAKLEAVRV